MHGICDLLASPCAGRTCHTGRDARKRVRTHCDSGCAGACAGKVHATGTGNWGFRGEGGGDGGGGTPDAGNWERRPAWAKTKDVDRQRVLLALSGLSTVRPSGPRGPHRASLSSVLSGPHRPRHPYRAHHTPWPGLINCPGPERASLPRPVPLNPHSTSHIYERYRYVFCIMIGHRRTPKPNKHTTTWDMLCTTATASVTVYIWAVTGQGGGKQSPHARPCSNAAEAVADANQQTRDADADADAHHRLCTRVCMCVCCVLCVTRLTRRPACSPVAQQLSICQACQSHDDGLIVIPAGLGDHRTHTESWTVRLEHRR